LLLEHSFQIRVKMLEGRAEFPVFPSLKQNHFLGLYYMILLKSIGTAQEVKFIPTRVGIPNELVLTNETTNVTTSQYIDCTTESFYSKFSEVLTLEESHFYSLVINENRDKTAIDNFASRVVADSGVFEAESCLLHISFRF